MYTMLDPSRGNEDGYDFKWGIKRGVGRKNRDNQFYESFTYDGEEYFLYDCVFLYLDGDLETSIGKLVRMWETPEREKNVRVVWFFRPVDIRNYLGDNIPHWNEIFLASGEGKGIYNDIPLEALVGKCNVVCTSKDERNPPVSRVELREADYFFRCTFDTGSMRILEEFPDLIDGIKVEYFFNRKKDQKRFNPHNLKANLEVTTQAIDSTSTLDISASDTRPLKKRKSLHANTEKELPRLDSNTSPSDLRERSNTKIWQPLQIISTSESDISALDMCPLKKRRDLLHNPEKEVPGLGPNTSPSGLREKSNIKTLLLLQNASKGDPKILTGSLLRLPEYEEKILDLNYSTSPNRALSKKVKSDEKAVMISNKAASLPAQVDVINACSGSMDEKKWLGLRPNASPSELRERSKTKTLLPQNASKGVTKILTGSLLRLKKNLDMSDSASLNRELSKKVKPDEKAVITPNKAASLPAQNDGISACSGSMDANRRLDADRRSWFKELPWDERIKGAHEQGTLVLLENLDPSYTSSEVEDLVGYAFNVRATVKMIQCSSFSSPHNGKAFVIFKSKEVADMVISQLKARCLMLTDGRPVIGCRKAPTNPSKPNPSKLPRSSVHWLSRNLKNEYMRNAVSTAHYSQPNTLEFDLAIEWRALQERSDLWWKALYQQHSAQIQNLKCQLKKSF